MRLSSIENGISVLRTTGCGPTAWRIRSSRYSVMSSAPVGTSWPLISLNRSARAAGRAARRACGCRRAPAPRRRGCARGSRARCASRRAGHAVRVHYDRHHRPLRGLAGNRVKSRRIEHCGMAGLQDGGIGSIDLFAILAGTLLKSLTSPQSYHRSSVVRRNERDRPLVGERALEEIRARVAVHVAADRQPEEIQHRRRDVDDRRRARAAAPRATDAP